MVQTPDFRALLTEVGPQVCVCASKKSRKKSANIWTNPWLKVEEIYFTSPQIQNSGSQIPWRRARMMRFCLLLPIFALCLTLPIKEDTLHISNPSQFTTNSETKTFPASDIFISSLLPPSSISDCLTSGYCNQGNCVQGIFLSICKIFHFEEKSKIPWFHQEQRLHQMATLGRFSASVTHPSSTLRMGFAPQGGSLRTWPPGSGPRKSCLLHSGRAIVPFQHLVWSAGWRLVLPQLRRPHVHLDGADQACPLLHQRSPLVLHVRLVHCCMLHLFITSKYHFLLQNMLRLLFQDLHQLWKQDGQCWRLSWRSLWVFHKIHYRLW